MGRTAVITVVLTALVLVLGGLVFIYSGAYNVSATSAHTGPVRWVLETAQERSIRARVEDVPGPPKLDSLMIRHGFEHYREMCEVCHGAPGVERGELGQGLNPEPPELMEEAEEWDARELFWIVKHGIKMTGMPAFGPTHSDEELWGIVGFVRQLPRVSAEDYQRMAAELERSGGETDHSHPAGTPPHAH